MLKTKKQRQNMLDMVSLTAILAAFVELGYFIRYISVPGSAFYWSSIAISFGLSAALVGVTVAVVVACRSICVAAHDWVERGER